MTQPELEFGHSRPTQANAILGYLRGGNRVTPISALNLFGCFRLAARVCELRKAGWPITEKKVVTPTGKRVAEYSLEVSCG